MCNGQVIPREPTTATAIEYTHRVTSGVLLVLVAGLSVWARRRFPSGSSLRRALAWSLVFLLTEALLGAMLVKLELVANNASANRAVAMSLHLANTFLLLAAMTTATMFSFLPEPKLASAPPTRQKWFLLVALGSILVVGMSGAVAALGDTLVQHGVQHVFVEVLVKLRIGHPLLAIVGMGSIALVVVSSQGSPAGRLSWVLAGLGIGQVLCGLLNVVLSVPVTLQLLHLLLADLIWMALIGVWHLSRLSEWEPTLSSHARRGLAVD
jgi:heme A synthase